jgi:hypothetical protein
MHVPWKSRALTNMPLQTDGRVGRFAPRCPVRRPHLPTAVVRSSRPFGGRERQTVNRTH